MAKTARLELKVEAWMKEVVQEVAKIQRRSVNQLIEICIEDEIMSLYPDKVFGSMCQSNGYEYSVKSLLEEKEEGYSLTFWPKGGHKIADGIEVVSYVSKLDLYKRAVGHLKEEISK